MPIVYCVEGAEGDEAEKGVEKAEFGKMDEESVGVAEGRVGSERVGCSLVVWFLRGGSRQPHAQFGPGSDFAPQSGGIRPCLSPSARPALLPPVDRRLPEDEGGGGLDRQHVAELPQLLSGTRIVVQHFIDAGRIEFAGTVAINGLADPGDKFG